jgi:hypothetical protein
VVVPERQLDPAAADSPGGVGPLNREQHPVSAGLSDVGVVPGQLPDEAEDDRLRRGAGSAEEQDTGQGRAQAPERRASNHSMASSKGMGLPKK